MGKVLTYLCTFRSLSSPSSTCAPCSAFGQRLARDNNSATHARLSRFSAFALRLLVSCCCQAVARCSRTFLYAPLLVLVFLGSCRLLFGKSPLCKQKSSVQDVQPSTTSVVLFLCQAVGEVLTYFVYAPRLVLVFLDLCALFRVWSTFDKRYSAAFRDVQRLLCARLSLCFKHAPRLVLVFLGSCRLLFASHLFASKKAVFKTYNKSTAICRAF